MLTHTWKSQWPHIRPLLSRLTSESPGNAPTCEFIKKVCGRLLIKIRRACTKVGMLIRSVDKMINLENKIDDKGKFNFLIFYNPQEDGKFSLIRAEINGLTSEDLNHQEISKYNPSKITLRDWLSRRYPIPICFINDNVSPSRIQYLCLRGGKHKIKFPKFNEDFFYFAGVIFGDGCVRDSMRKKGYRSYRIVLDNEINDYSNVFLPNLTCKIFGIKPKITFMTRKSKLIRLDICSKIITRIFTNILRFSYGKKKDDVIDYVETMPITLQKSFIAGLFDTDGGKSWNSYSLGNTSFKAINFVRRFLESHKISTKTYKQIYTTSTYYHLRIHPKDKEEFFSIVPVKNKSKFSEIP